MKKSIIEKTIEAPAEALEFSVEEGQKLAKAIATQGTGIPLKKARDYWAVLGPGLTTGASDDDPSGIATYSQAGAQYGFNLLWTAAFTYPLMAVVQEMCARIGLVTGRGLAANIKNHFGRKVLYFSALLLFAANTFNIGADLGAMASGIQLLNPTIRYGALVLAVTFFIMLVQIFTPYAKYARYLKWLALILFAYILSAILAHPDWGVVIKHSIIPKIEFNKNYIFLLTAVLGTTITPYLFFWQTSQEIENEIVAGEKTIKQRQLVSRKQITDMRVDVWSGMFLSNVVAFFIIAACAAVLYSHGITNINTAAQAAEALRPFAGNATYWLFALGIIGVGLLAIPVLAGASAYAISESLGKHQGLNQKLKQGSAFYGVIIISMLVGLSLNFIGLNPIKALIYSAVLNGVVAPIILVQIMLIARNKHIMHEWKNGKASALLGWLLTIIMAAAGIATVYSIFSN